MINLPDMQKTTEGFPKIPIGKVGVRNIEYPIPVSVKGNGINFTPVATISSYCDLVEDVKGINMSRITRTIFKEFGKLKGKITDISAKCVQELKTAHGTDDIYLKVKFKYPYHHRSPYTPELDSPEVVDVEIETTLAKGVMKQFMTVELVGMSLCPCSKEMSLLKNNLTSAEEDYLSHVQDEFPELHEKLMRAGFGAHNQKSFVKVTVELTEEMLWIEDLVELIYKSTSAPTFSVLKRPDEKWVTEASYMGGYYDDKKEWVEVPNAGPKFVEDISRQAADQLNELIGTSVIRDYVIVVRNQESIHSGGIEAVAVLNAGRNLK